MKRDMMTARFKRDYVACMAVVLFFAIIVAEVSIAVWIPLQMRHDSLWAEQIVRLRLLSRFDWMRLSTSSFKSDDALTMSEAEAIEAQLNLIAVYLNNNNQGRDLSPEQILELKEVLDEIDRQWAKIKRGNPYGTALNLNTDQYIKNIAEGSI